MRIELVPIDSVFEDPKNARSHTEKQISDLAKSLKRFGQQYPLVVTEKDKIIRKGNGTHRAAKRNGWTEIYVGWSDLEPDEARAYAIADNKLGTNSEWNIDALTENMKELVTWKPNQDWESLGFEKEEITPLLGEGWDAPPDASGFDTEPAMEETSPAPEMGKPIKVTKEMRETIDVAISVLKLQEGDMTITEGRVIELICADWLAENISINEKPKQI